MANVEKRPLVCNTLNVQFVFDLIPAVVVSDWRSWCRVVDIIVPDTYFANSIHLRLCTVALFHGILFGGVDGPLSCPLIKKILSNSRARIGIIAPLPSSERYPISMLYLRQSRIMTLCHHYIRETVDIRLQPVISSL